MDQSAKFRCPHCGGTRLDSRKYAQNVYGCPDCEGVFFILATTSPREAGGMEWFKITYTSGNGQRDESVVQAYSAPHAADLFALAHLQAGAIRVLAVGPDGDRPEDGTGADQSYTVRDGQARLLMDHREAAMLRGW